MSRLSHATLADVRSVIGRAIVGERRAVLDRLGHITLRPEQRLAAGRLIALMELHGGAMLAEPVGLGKTFTALAAARAFNETILIAAPAALRDMWATALRDAEVSAEIVAHETLSRGVSPTGEPGIVIIDEAHRLRSTSAKRYATLAHVARRSRILLVTATPVQNRRDDLAAQLALFLGRRAWSLCEGDLTSYVVRESSLTNDGHPALSGPHAVTLDCDDDCVDVILALPPPVPASDESIAIALTTFGLVHQWTSSRAALIAALDRRRARAAALRAALESGRRPTRAELSAWTHAEDAVQLAFPELVVDARDAPADGNTALLEAVDRHDGALRDLIRRLRGSSIDSDAERAAAIRRIRAAHPGERVIAFCHYMETVNSLWSQLARDPGMAALTARGARVAGGPIDRASVLAQFEPRSADSPAIADVERISVLITTDLLSEGLNLQEASVIVHLDLPWNPARLEQRVGRARRLGSRHPVVTVYAFMPPASADRLLHIGTRLQSKLATARSTIGESAPALPWMTEPSTHERVGAAEQLGAVHAYLRAWAASAPRTVSSSECTLVAAVAAQFSGTLALVVDGQRARLVADVGHGISTDPSSVYRAVDACKGRERSVDDERSLEAMSAIQDWLAEERGAAAVHTTVGRVDTSRRSAATRIATILAASPRHRRVDLATQAAVARRALTTPLSEGSERVLDSLLASTEPDDRWLSALADFAREHVTDSTAHEHARIVAIILFEHDERVRIAGGG